MFYFSDFEITFGNTLFPDAKMAEDVVEDGVGGDGAVGDGGEMVEGVAEILTDEVGGEGGGEAVADAEEGGAGGKEGFVVAEIADYKVGAVEVERLAGGVAYPLLKLVEAFAGEGGDGKPLSGYPLPPSGSPQPGGGWAGALWHLRCVLFCLVLLRCV